MDVGGSLVVSGDQVGVGGGADVGRSVFTGSFSSNENFWVIAILPITWLLLPTPSYAPNVR